MDFNKDKYLNIKVQKYIYIFNCQSIFLMNEIS